MATRSKRPARDDARAHTTVAYRGDELDELIAQSSELPAMSQTELLESAPTVAQMVMELEDDEYELAPLSREETVEAVGQETLEADADAEPIPESVPVVESTVVLAGSAELAHGLSHATSRLSSALVPVPASVNAPAYDSQRPVAYDIPSSPSIVLPTAYTLTDGVQAVSMRSAARAPALITLTIAVVAITVGVLLGSTFSEALSQPPARTNAAAATADAAAPERPTEPPRHAEPRTSVDEKVSLADAGVREKAVRPTKPIGMMIAPRAKAPSQQTSQAAFEAELRSKMQKAPTPTAEALGEAQLNRPF